MSGGFAQLDLTHYGAIGNGRSVLLCGRDGNLAFGCLPELDRPSVFASLLDARRGGGFRIAAEHAALGEQRYLDDSNVLETRFEARGAALTLTDFMPVARRNGRIVPGECEIHRMLRAGGGDVEVAVDLAPRFDYARAVSRVALHEGGWLAVGGGESLFLAGLPDDAQVDCEDDEHGNATLRARFTLRKDAACALVLRYGARSEAADPDASERALRTTLAAWRHWARSGCDVDWARRHAPLVRRSALALKLLCHPDTGAIAAAATTSLPEAIGGERNWDYRYAWLRDAGMTVEALLGAGHPHEARAFLEFIARAESRGNPHGPWLQLVFGMHGETDLPQRELAHLAGYRDSRPVRIGNHIAKHRGHDIYEQILGAALEFLALGHELPEHVMRFLGRVADTAADEWRRPDHGIWELPDGPRHYVHSKWTLCVALDHAERLAREFGMPGNVARWRRERAACCEEVLERGWDARRGRFRMAYDLDALDAANVLMPVLGFLPADDARVQATLAATLDELVIDDLCYRYVLDDGLRGKEGCFVACTFWMVEALALAGDLEKARWMFDCAAARCGPLGLWTEQIDLRRGTHLGNLPQAFSHVAFHDAALRLARAEGRRVPVDPDPARMSAPAQGASP